MSFLNGREHVRIETVSLYRRMEGKGGGNTKLLQSFCEAVCQLSCTLLLVLYTLLRSHLSRLQKRFDDLARAGNFDNCKTNENSNVSSNPTRWFIRHCKKTRIHTLSVLDCLFLLDVLKRVCNSPIAFKSFIFSTSFRSLVLTPFNVLFDIAGWMTVDFDERVFLVLLVAEELLIDLFCLAMFSRRNG